ncbi:hypothetical protein EJB05_52432, partial [Eragrostis curvula]
MLSSSATPPCKRMKPASPDSTAEADWAELPWDILVTVFLNLGPGKVMLGADAVCRAWRRVAVEEPALWRRVGWHAVDHPQRIAGFGEEMKMAEIAMERAAGQCEAFWVSSCDYSDLCSVVERAPSLKSLDIQRFTNDSTIANLSLVLKELPLLENLQIYFRYLSKRHDDLNLLQSVCRACPHLKALMLRNGQFPTVLIDREIPWMQELRTLELHGCDLSGKSLKTILDNCPLLESLHITVEYYGLLRLIIEN